MFGALFKGLTSVVVLKVERALYIRSPQRQFLPDLRLEPATTTTGPEEEPEHMNNLVVNWSTLIALNILHLVMQ